MRFLFLLVVLINSSLAANACSSVGPLCTKFLNTTLAKLTTKFKVTDGIVCQIGTDLGNCIADAKTFQQCTDVLASKEKAYMTQLGFEKAAMLGDLMSFQGCLSNTNDLALTKFLSKTLLVALNNKLKKPYNKKILPKMKTMKANGKAVAERVEQACKLGTAMATANLISQVIKKDMALTCKNTWQQCVMGQLVEKGILTIGKFVKPAFKNKPNCPSG